MTTKSVRSKQQKLITNITGKASDKLKLTKRLNEAVDDLIKMGQRYREKSQLIASQIPYSNDATSAQQSLDSFKNIQGSKCGAFSSSNIPEVFSPQKFGQTKKTRQSQLPSQHAPESSLMSIDEIVRQSDCKDDAEASQQQTPPRRTISKLKQRSKIDTKRLVQSSYDSGAMNKNLIKEPDNVSQEEQQIALITEVTQSGDRINAKTEQTPHIQNGVTTPNLQSSYSKKSKQIQKMAKQVYVSFDAVTAQAQNIKHKDKTALEPIIITRTPVIEQQAKRKQSGVTADQSKQMFESKYSRQKSEDCLPSLTGNQSQNQRRIHPSKNNDNLSQTLQSSHCSLKSSTRMGRDKAGKCCSGTSSQRNFKMQITETNAINATPKIKREGSEASARAIQQKLAQEIKKITKSKAKLISKASNENESKNKKPSSTQGAQSAQKKNFQSRKNSQESAQLSTGQKAVQSQVTQPASEEPENLQERLNQLFAKKSTYKNQENQARMAKALKASEIVDQRKKSPRVKKRQVSRVEALQERTRTHQEPSSSQRDRYNAKLRSNKTESGQTFALAQSSVTNNQATLFSSNYLLKKDQAIEMIQTGPPEQFSHVLRQYLSSQQQQTGANQGQILSSLDQHPQSQKRNSNQSRDINKVGGNSSYALQKQSQHASNINMAPLPLQSSEFTRAQQHLLAKNMTGKRSVIYNNQNSNMNRNEPLHLVRAHSTHYPQTGSQRVAGANTATAQQICRTQTKMSVLTGSNMASTRRAGVGGDQSILTISKPVRQLKFQVQTQQNQPAAATRITQTHQHRNNSNSHAETTTGKEEAADVASLLTNSIDKKIILKDKEMAKNIQSAYRDQFGLDQKKTNDGLQQKVHLKQQHKVVRNILNDENQRRVVKIAHAYSGKQSRDNSKLRSRQKLTTSQEEDDSVMQVDSKSFSSNLVRKVATSHSNYRKQMSQNADSRNQNGRNSSTLRNQDTSSQITHHNSLISKPTLNQGNQQLLAIGSYQQADQLTKQNILTQDLSMKESEIALKLHLKNYQAVQDVNQNHSTTSSSGVQAIARQNKLGGGKRQSQLVNYVRDASFTTNRSGAAMPAVQGQQRLQDSNCSGVSQKIIRNIIVERQRQQQHVEALTKSGVESSKIAPKIDSNNVSFKRAALSRNEVLKKRHTDFTDAQPLTNAISGIEQPLGCISAAQRTINEETSGSIQPTNQSKVLSDASQKIQQYRSDSRQKRRNILISDKEQEQVLKDPKVVELESAILQKQQQLDSQSSRPRPQRPAFLNFQSQQNTNQADAPGIDRSLFNFATHLRKQAIPESQLANFANDQSALPHAASNRVQNRSAMRPAADAEKRMNLQRVEQRTKTQIEPSSNKLTLEEQIQQSSIMAIQLESGLTAPTAQTRSNSQTVENTSISQALYNRPKQPPGGGAN